MNVINKLSDFLHAEFAVKNHYSLVFKTMQS